jgi:hypothetical protein
LRCCGFGQEGVVSSFHPQEEDSKWVDEGSTTKEKRARERAEKAAEKAEAAARKKVRGEYRSVQRYCISP